MERLKVIVIKLERAVVMQVLAMPEEWRGKGLICEVDGFSVDSDTFPGIYVNLCSLRGTDRNDDFRIDFDSFDSNEERDVYYNRLTAALKEAARIARGEGKETAQPFEFEVIS